MALETGGVLVGTKVAIEHNTQVIASFRRNEGTVAGAYAGLDLLLVGLALGRMA